MRLFISYARADDKPFVETLYNRLTALGHTVWYDRESLPSRGETFLQEIRNAIYKADRLLLVVGPGAAQSEYVRFEYEHANQYCIPVIPILCKPIGETNDNKHDYDLIPSPFRSLHCPDFRPPRALNEALSELLRLLNDSVTPLGECKGVAQLPSWYIPRFAQLESLKNRILPSTNSSVAPIAIHGMAGIGKTVIATALCYDCDVRRAFPDGVYWMQIGNIADVDLLGRMRRLGDMLGLNTEDFKDVEAARLRLEDTLKHRATLIILDDVWKHQQAEIFKDICGVKCRLIITTRQEAIAVKLGALGQLVDVLNEDDTLALFAARLELQRTAEKLLVHKTTMSQIRAQLGGHTLSLSIAAAWLKINGLDLFSKLLTRLIAYRQSTNPFAELKLDDTDRNYNLELSLRLSYEDLGKDDALQKKELQRHFRCSGIFAEDGTFDVAAAKAVCSAQDDDKTKSVLSALVEAGLLQQEGERFKRHSLLKTYGQALLRRENEYAAVWEHYAEHFIEVAAQFKELPPEKWSPVELNMPNIITLGDMLFDQFQSHLPNETKNLTERVLRFTLNVQTYLRNHRELQRLGWLEMGLAASHQLSDQHNEALFSNELGLAWSALGEKKRALEYYEKALTIDRALDEIRNQAISLINIGGVWSDLGDKRLALQFYEHAESLCYSLEDWSSLATVLNNMGTCWLALGETSNALDFLEQSLALYKRLVDDKKGEARTLANIGGLRASLGEKYLALDYYEQALYLIQLVDNKQMETTLLSNIGAIWDELGEVHTALKYYEQALPLRHLVGDRAGEATTLNSIGMAWSALGEHQHALEYFEKALPLRRLVGDKYGEATTINNIGGVWSALGEKNIALEYYKQALDLRRAINDLHGEILTLNNIASIYHSFGKYSEASEILRQIIPIAQKMRSAADEAAYSRNLAVLLEYINGPSDEIIGLLERGITLLKSNRLSQDSSGKPLTEYYTFLAEMRAKTGGIRRFFKRRGR